MKTIAEYRAPVVIVSESPDPARRRRARRRAFGAALLAAGAGVPAAAPTAAAGGAQIELERRVSEVYRTASPAVVNLTTQVRSFDWLRGRTMEEGSGSGFLYDDRGHIVTNFHVIESAAELQVTFADGEVRGARLVGSDPTNDLAVIRVEPGPEGRRALALGDSESLEVGRFVIAIGHPFGLDQTLTTGVVSGLGRVIESPDRTFIGEIIQTDAAINQGNSGGPLLDLEGRVVGVNSAIVSPTGASAGIGYAIPAATLARVVPELIRNGRYPHPHLAVSVQEIPPRLAGAFRRAGVAAPEDGGLMVRSVAAGGPAARAGIRGTSRVGRLGNLRIRYGGDYLLAVDGERVASRRDLMLLLETNYRVGDEVELEIWRDGERLSPGVRLVDRDTLRRRRRR